MPPETSGSSSSSAAKSNANDAIASTESDGANPKLSLAWATMFATPRCAETAPLGCPVEPEV